MTSRKMRVCNLHCYINMANAFVWNKVRNKLNVGSKSDALAAQMLGTWAGSVSVAAIPGPLNRPQVWGQGHARNGP